MREHRDLGPREGLRSLDEFIDGLHERLDGAVRVVSGDMVVELLPEALDHVRLRRVRRQEVEYDTAAEPGQVAERPSRFVNDEVVEDEVDALGAPVGTADRIDQGEEEVGVLPLGDDVDDLAAPGVQRAGHVPLHVLARGENDELLAPAYVREADPRVEVDVGLVHVDDLVLGVGAVHEVIDFVQDSTPATHRDSQANPRPTPANQVREQHVPDVAWAQAHAGVERQLDREQLQRPGRPLPAAVLRRAVDVADEPLFDVRSDLAASPELSLVEERVLSEILEAG